MLGAIVGDIVGSRFEWNNIKTKKFDFFTDRCSVTDDSIMSLAIAKALLLYPNTDTPLGTVATQCMQELGRKYPYAGYGMRFWKWMRSKNPQPYHSWGNGAAMRVSACGYAATSLDEAIKLSREVTEVTHNHPEGLKGAESTAVAIYLAKIGKNMGEIRSYIDAQYYAVDFKLDEIRESYRFDESCQGTVPQALAAFYESADFEDAIRNAISIGGDSDTIAAITGSIAEAYYGIPNVIRAEALNFLKEDVLEILFAFEKKYPPKISAKDLIT